MTTLNEAIELFARLVDYVGIGIIFCGFELLLES